MKYTIFGFSQKRLLELGLGVDDALVLDWFVTFQGSGRMRSMIVEGQAWYWVNYSGVLEDIPIAAGSEKTIARRFLKLKESGVLEHLTVRQGGTFSCFRLNESIYTSLISEVQDNTNGGKTNLSDGRTELSEGSQNYCINNGQYGDTNASFTKTKMSNGRTKMGDGVGQNCPTPSDKSVRPKDSLTKETLLPEELKEPPIAPTGGFDTPKASRTRFVKPSVEEIAAYCSQRDNGINAQEFADHYEANGWKVGKTPMKDWKAAVRTWEHTRSKNLKQAKARYHSEGTKAAPITGWTKLGGTV